MITPRQEKPEDPRQTQHLTAGQDFVRKIRPEGCVLFLGLFILTTALLFSSGRAPVRGYSAAQSTEYYQQDPEALVTELEDDLFPQLPDYDMTAAVGDDGTVTVTIDSSHFYVARAAILHYYDESLFTFVEQAE